MCRRGGGVGLCVLRLELFFASSSCQLPSKAILLLWHDVYVNNLEAENSRKVAGEVRLMYYMTASVGCPAIRSHSTKLHTVDHPYNK